MIYSNNVRRVSETHTVKEFVSYGQQNRDNIGYRDLSYIEKRDNLEYVVKNVLDDYLEELTELVKEVKLADWAVIKYRGNPKLLSYDLYNTTRYWHIILRINNLANTHDFHLESHKLKLIEPLQLKDFMSKVFNTEKFPLALYANAHERDETPKIIEKYVWTPDPSRKFNFV